METLVNVLWILATVGVLGMVVKILFFTKKNAPYTGGGSLGGGGGSTGGGSTDGGRDPRTEEPE